MCDCPRGHANMVFYVCPIPSWGTQICLKPICSILELYEEERGSSVVQSAFLCCLGLLQVLPATLLRHHLLEMRNVPRDDCSNCCCVECGGLLTARFAPALAG